MPLGSRGKYFILKSRFKIFMTQDQYLFTESPNKPDMTLKPISPLVCIEYNPKDPHCLVGGQYNGQLGLLSN